MKRFHRWRRVLAAACTITLLTACVGPRNRDAAGPSAWRDWARTSAASEQLAAQNRGAAADSALSDFIRRWPGTPQAEEGTWWLLARQAERVDDSASTAQLVERIDSLLTSAPASMRRPELQALRRVAMTAQQLRTERNAARAELAERDGAAKQRADELEKLRAELEAVKAELARVRQRVTRTRP